jgi:hypothetical protein
MEFKAKDHIFATLLKKGVFFPLKTPLLPY